jgi:RNA polymerase sigma-70 factor (ECF subfamily)
MSTMANSQASEQDQQDIELMRRLSAGDQDALEPLHGRYAPVVYLVAAQMTDRTAAEEIVQEVFLTVWRKASLFDPERGTFRAWLLRIAHSRALNELRRQSRRPALVKDRNGSQFVTVADPGDGPAEAAWRAYRRELLREAVDSLPAPQRRALSMAFLEEMSHAQVADLLNLPLGTAKSRIRAGLKRLRLRLAPLLAAGLLLIAGLVAFVRYETAQRERLRRLDGATALLTSSQIVPRRLVAAAGIPDASHGHYRGAAGKALAVLNVSKLARPMPGHGYFAWVRHGQRWTNLGQILTDASGNGLLIAESPVLATPPDAITITLAQTESGPEPSGRTVLVWPE